LRQRADDRMCHALLYQFTWLPCEAHPRAVPVQCFHRRLAAALIVRTAVAGPSGHCRKRPTVAGGPGLPWVSACVVIVVLDLSWKTSPGNTTGVEENGLWRVNSNHHRLAPWNTLDQAVRRGGDWNRAAGSRASRVTPHDRPCGCRRWC
jgi:hypothetical protein